MIFAACQQGHGRSIGERAGECAPVREEQRGKSRRANWKPHTGMAGPSNPWRLAAAPPAHFCDLLFLERPLSICRRPAATVGRVGAAAAAAAAVAASQRMRALIWYSLSAGRPASRAVVSISRPSPRARARLWGLALARPSGAFQCDTCAGQRGARSSSSSFSALGSSKRQVAGTRPLSLAIVLVEKKRIAQQEQGGAKTTTTTSSAA